MLLIFKQAHNKGVEEKQVQEICTNNFIPFFGNISFITKTGMYITIKRNKMEIFTYYTCDQ